MRKNVKLVLFIIFLGISLPGFAGEKIYPVFALSREPVLDGRIVDDPAWKDIPQAIGFWRFQSEDYALKQTSFGMGYLPGKALYLAFICREPEMGKIKAELRDMGNLWAEDSIEIFLFPEGADTYFQFIVNAIGSRWNGMGMGIPFPLGDWEAKSYKGKDFYSLEIKIPFTVLGREPKAGERWTGNLCRNIWTSPIEDKWTRWGRGAFHCPGTFVTIVFGGQGFQRETIGRQGFQEEMGRIEDNISDLEKGLLKLKDLPFFKGEVLPYLKEWEKTKKSLVHLNKFSINELFKIYEELVSLRASLQALFDEARKEFLRDLFFAE